MAAGEIVNLPVPLELGAPLDAAGFRVEVALTPPEQGASKTLATVVLPDFPQEITPARPVVGMQHSFPDVTFGERLDLLGYNLNGDFEAGLFQIRLYWLNRDGLWPAEAQVQVLAAENGTVIAQETRPVPTSPTPWTWRSASRYELVLNTPPAAVAIRVRPVGGAVWSQVQGRNLSGSDVVIIDDVLAKTAAIVD